MIQTTQDSEISVDIWMWDNADLIADAPHLATLLDAEEIARRDRQASLEKGQHWAISRAKVRTYLAQILDMPARALEFEENEFGKLSLAGTRRAGLDFSISHDDSWTVLAICKGAPVGVDIESVKTLTREEMDWPLSRVERQHLAEVVSDDVPQAFFRYWTLKEAFIKGLGLGVSFPLEDFDMTPCGEPPGLLRVKGDPEAVKNWVFEAYEIRPGLRFALAVRTGGIRPELAYHTNIAR